MPIKRGPTFRRLAAQNKTLSQVELGLLADALDHEGDVVIGYRDRKGKRTVRRIRPEQLLGDWLDSLPGTDHWAVVAELALVQPG